MKRLLAALALFGALAGCARAPVKRVCWTTMGTVAAVQTRGAENPAAVAIVRKAFDDVERLLNAHNPDSELSRLAPLSEEDILAKCDPRMRPCYETAFRLMRESGGAFNPRWRGPRTLDLGGIAKGFALDLAGKELIDHADSAGTDDILVDLGGNLKVVRGKWSIGVYQPPDAASRPTAFTQGPGYSCATSAEYARGKHIYDGRTGLAVTNEVVSVTVVHPKSAMLADGLSTILFILGRDRGDAFLRAHCPEAEAIWIMSNQEGMPLP